MSKIFAVIVCYEPDRNIYKLITDLNDQSVLPVIVDNSEKNRLVLSANCKYKYIALKQNIGIAAAQNIGIEYCIKNGANVVVFFDQDSKISSSLIEKLYIPIMERRTNISVPIYRDERKGFFYKIVNINKFGIRKVIIPNDNMPYFVINNAISSGTMMHIDTIKKVGCMDSTLFIDYVDTEWFLRASFYGETALVITDAIMEHTIGDKIIDLKLCKIPVHSPLRRYYRVRNSIKLLKYKHIPKLLALREIIFSIVHHCIILICCKHQKEYVYYFYKAFLHGLIGRNGKFKK